MNLIKNLWKGNVSLPMTYWVYGVVFTNIYVFLLLLVMEHPVFGEMLSLIFISLILILAQLVHMTVSVWNSSTQYIINKKSENKSAFWGYAARVALVFGLLRGLAEFLRELNAPY